MRKVLIFGNGVGRALDNDYFNLENALEKAWDDPTVLDDTQKALIRQCLPEDVIEDDETIAPKSEEELDILQRILAACDEISQQERGAGPAWLTPEGKAFPAAIRRYIHRAACYFHEGPYTLPSTFTKPLIDFIVSTRSHVATLNYDELLYRSFVQTSVFSGYSCMIDGFVRSFNNESLSRRSPNRQCYYLHLHGSPLFYTDNNGETRKASMSSLPSIVGYSSNHLVLTHVAHKASVIAASPVLSAYWTRLAEACQEAQAIVLVGYSGGDVHLNQLISSYAADKQLEIVERRTPAYSTREGSSARFQYWESLLGKTPYAHWRDSVLDFTTWDWYNAVSPAVSVKG